MMKKLLLFILFCGLFLAAALPARAAAETPEFFPWAQSIMEATRSADFMYKVKSLFNTAPKRPTFEEVYRHLQKQVSISSKADLFLRRARALNAALTKNHTFQGYVFTVQFAADLGPDLPQEDYEYLHAFLSSSYKLGEFNTRYLPREALHYENGAVFIALTNQNGSAREPMYLIVSPRVKTVQFIYADPQFDRRALQGRSYRLW